MDSTCSRQLLEGEAMRRLPEPVSRLEHALLSLDRVSAERVLMESVSDDARISTIEQLVVPALERIGTAWEQGKVALSQVYMAGRICEELVDAHLPPNTSHRTSQPRVAITVLEDYHLLGKRIVYSMLRTSGFDLLDLGRTDVSTLVARVRQETVGILLISTLMLASAIRVKEVRSMLDAAGADVKIVVGGAPFRMDANLWREVGADAMGSNASEAMAIVSTLLGAAS